MPNEVRRNLWSDLRFGLGLAFAFTLADWFGGQVLSLSTLCSLAVSNLLTGIVISIVGSWVIRRAMARREGAKTD